MGLKPLLCLLVSMLLLTSSVCSKDEEMFLVKVEVVSDYSVPQLQLASQGIDVKPPVVAPVTPPTPAVPTLPPPHLPTPATPTLPSPQVPLKPPAPVTPSLPPPPQAPIKQPSPTPATPPTPPKTRLDCIPLCVGRCKLHSRKNMCARACMTCCERCKCVPPGTYGNREKCGKCYTDMTTHGGKLKCP